MMSSSHTISLPHPFHDESIASVSLHPSGGVDSDLQSKSLLSATCVGTKPLLIGSRYNSRRAHVHVSMLK